MTLSPSTAQDRLDNLQREMRRCRRCQENGFPVEGPAVFSGPASARILLVGQAPARVDLDHGSQPWSGTGGRRLMAWLTSAGFEEDAFRQSQYLAALTRCFPGKQDSGRGDRPPSRAEQALCLPCLAREIEIIQPRTIITVGRMAAERFLGQKRLTELVGDAHTPNSAAIQAVGVEAIPGFQILPLPHPSGASLWLNTPSHRAMVDRALARLSDLRQTLDL